MSPEIEIFMAFGAYIVATASPGPATLGILAVAARNGRRAGLSFAAGVITGSIFWGICAAFGLASVMAEFGAVLLWIKILGGAYLIYLAWKSFRSALSTDDMADPTAPRPENLFRQGLFLHLTNPKAVLAWVAIISIGITPESGTDAGLWVMGGCAILGAVVFGGYAVLFSTGPMMAGYRAARRPIEFLMSAVFGSAGLSLITGRL